MRGHVEQAVLLHLALDLDQRVAQPAQQRDGRRLVVDEGAAAAVGADHAAQGQDVVVVESLLGEDRVGRMVLRQLEAAATEAWAAPRRTAAAVGARAERQAECVDQDGFAGAGLAGQRAQAAIRPAREGRGRASRSARSRGSKAREACRPGQKIPKNQPLLFVFRRRVPSPVIRK